MSEPSDGVVALAAIVMIILTIGFIYQAVELAIIRVQDGYCHGVLAAKGWTDEIKKGD